MTVLQGRTEGEESKEAAVALPQGAAIVAVPRNVTPVKSIMWFVLFLIYNQ